MDAHFIKPLDVALRGSGFSLEDVRRYSEAMHAPDFNRFVAERNNDMPDAYAGKGLSDVEAAAIVEEYSKRERFEKLREAHEILVSMNRWYLDSRLETGLISQDLRDQLYNQSPFYVPLHVERMEEDGLFLDGIPKRDLSSREFKTAIGHAGRENVDVVGQSLFQAYEAIDRGLKNLAYKNFTDALLQLGKETLKSHGIRIAKVRGVNKLQWFQEHADHALAFKRDGEKVSGSRPNK